MIKYVFYIVIIGFIYRVFFSPKVIVEHRHFYDKKPKETKKKLNKNGDFTDYEEVE